MNILKKLTFLLVTLALLSSSLLSAQAQDAVSVDATAGSESAVDSSEAKLVTRKDISLAEQEAALAFWSRAAIAAAQPMALPAQVGSAEVDAAALSSPAVTGPAGFSAAGMAAPGAAQVAQKAYPLDWAALEVVDEVNAVSADSLLQADGTSQIFTSYTVNQLVALQRLYPHVWVGRLSFSTPGGTSYCSGTSISGNVMLTAAHCVYNTATNQFYSNWSFTPAYRAGNAPYGVFPATTCWVLNTWVALSGAYNINTWAPHDVAVCKMGNNAAGQTLNTAVGWMGRQWNQSYIRHFHTLGYPFNDYNNVPLPNAGQYLRTCVAESRQQAAEVRGMGCNYGPGISGGPWMIGYAIGVASGAADGVNSGLFVGVQNLYGARFNSNNIVPLCTAAAC